jgi:hypothetical protein
MVGFYIFTVKVWVQFSLELKNFLGKYSLIGKAFVCGTK